MRAVVRDCPSTSGFGASSPRTALGLTRHGEERGDEAIQGGRGCVFLPALRFRLARNGSRRDAEETGGAKRSLLRLCRFSFLGPGRNSGKVKRACGGKAPRLPFFSASLRELGWPTRLRQAQPERGGVLQLPKRSAHPEPVEGCCLCASQVGQTGFGRLSGEGGNFLRWRGLVKSRLLFVIVGFPGWFHA